jgi:hypothetical protein
MTSPCGNEETSWLRLERHALGELPSAEGERVQQHLGDCAMCQTCMDSIVADAYRPLPSLNIGTAKARWVWPWRLSCFAGAGAAALLLVSPWTQHGDVRTKGAEAAWELTREHDGTQTTQPTVYVPGDRFKISMTCAEANDRHWDVVIKQDGRLFFPLAGGTSACGNNVVLPGAFTLSGKTTATVCLLLSDDGAPQRGKVDDQSIDALTTQGRCMSLGSVEPT